MRLTLNAKAAINRFRVSLERVYYNDKVQGASDENACAQCIFLLIALWSRHAKPSSAKGEKRLKRKKIPKFVQAEALPESEIMYKSEDRCTGMKDRITRPPPGERKGGLIRPPFDEGGFEKGGFSKPPSKPLRRGGGSGGGGGETRNEKGEGGLLEGGFARNEKGFSPLTKGGFEKGFSFLAKGGFEKGGFSRGASRGASRGLRRGFEKGGF